MCTCTMEKQLCLARHEQTETARPTQAWPWTPQGVDQKNISPIVEEFIGHALTPMGPVLRPPSPCEMHKSRIFAFLGFSRYP